VGDVVISPGTIQVDGLTLNQFDDPDENDVLWLFDEVDGWHDGPSVEVESQGRAIAHGQFAQVGRRGGRTITVNGNMVAPDRASAGDAVDRLSSLLAGGEFGRFDFYDVDQGWRWTQVQLAATPDLAWETEKHCRFQLQFLAPDAYRYGQTSTASVGFAASSGSGLVFDLFNPAGFLNFGPAPEFGIVSVQNPGTAAASPVFTVSGPSPSAGFVITDVSTGKRITFLGVVPAGSVLTLDASDGSVLLDGVADRLGDALVEAWPVVPARSVAQFLFEPLSSATDAQMGASVTATYW
jgi:hypothetical protein